MLTAISEIFTIFFSSSLMNTVILSLGCCCVFATLLKIVGGLFNV